MNLKVFVISLMIGLAVGYHILVAVSYTRDWDSQQSFFQQLALRVPGLKPDTSIYYQYNISLHNFRSTDNSLTAPLNWIYSPNFSSQRIPYKIYDLRLRANILPPMEKGYPIRDTYGSFAFSGSTDEVLVIHYAPPACLRVLHPKYDIENHRLPDEINAALSISNLEQIEQNPNSPATLPNEVFKMESELTWCEYFQKADLARQLGDWQEVVRIGEIAFHLDDFPKNETEFIPFIQGYAHVGQWEQAVKLTHKTLDIHEFAKPMLCSIWTDLEKSTSDSPGKSEALEQIYKSLECTLF